MPRRGACETRSDSTTIRSPVCAFTAPPPRRATLPPALSGRRRQRGERRARQLEVAHTSLLVRSCGERRDKLLGVGGPRIEKLNRDVVVGPAKGDLVGTLRFEPERPAHRRDVNGLRISKGSTPTAGALDHPAPERDGTHY